ncbi:MAG: hypothetical protein HUN05_13450 [Desulfobacter sp.]|nr:MAG: hypothetical protein HUN05_13450 [Desulfobacter sp.]
MLGILIFPGSLMAKDSEYNRYDAGFKNFLTCELTRTDAEDHFKGKDFTITMISLHSIVQESGIVILTGAVQCFVKDEYHTLYPAVGIEMLAGKEVVFYYTIRKKNFSILATELIRFPYKERCPWTRYWIDQD